MAALAAKDHETISQLAYDTQTELVRGMAAGDKSTIEGIELSPAVAETLTRNTRRKSTEVRLDGVYRLVKLDWSDPLKFRLEYSTQKQTCTLTQTFKTTPLMVVTKRLCGGESGVAHQSP